MMKRKKTDQKKYITLNKTNVNAGLVSWYRTELTNLVNKMYKIYEKQILKLFKENKEQIKQIRYATDDNIGSQARILLNKLDRAYSEYYDNKGKKVSEAMVEKTSKLLQTSFEVSFYSFLKKLDKKADGGVIAKVLSQFSPDIMSDKAKFVKAFSLKKKLYNQVATNLKKTMIMNNVELIKSIHQQFHREISQSVYDCIVNGRPQKELISMIKTCGQKTTRRANLIATDQVNKTHSVLYRQELKQNGITKARWIHIGGGKTDRKTHIAKAPNGLNGAIFDLTKGIYDKAVNKFIQPAELPFCRCQAEPILEV